MWLPLLAQATSDPGLSPGILGVSGVCVVLAVGGWRAEKARADKTQEQLVELLEKITTVNVETVQALRSSTHATESLTSEVRRLGERER